MKKYDNIEIRESGLSKSEKIFFDGYIHAYRTQYNPKLRKKIIVYVLNNEDPDIHARKLQDGSVSCLSNNEIWELLTDDGFEVSKKGFGTIVNQLCRLPYFGSRNHKVCGSTNTYYFYSGVGDINKSEKKKSDILKYIAP